MSTHAPTTLLFLPGASGNTTFWQPTAERIAHTAKQVLLGWPGFGATPADPQVAGIDDLVTGVLRRIERPTALIAQSMGGIVAMRVALARPDLITHLVLCATSGGIDISDLDTLDWRPGLLAAQPSLPRWFIDTRAELSAQLDAITIPVLLIWGDADPISPVAVGRRLASLLPNAQLHVLAGATHDLTSTHGAHVAALIDAYLAAPSLAGAARVAA